MGVIEDYTERIFVCQGDTSTEYVLPIVPTNLSTCTITKLSDKKLYLYIQRYYGDIEKSIRHYRSVRVNFKHQLVAVKNISPLDWDGGSLSLNWNMAEVEMAPGRYLFSVVFSTSLRFIYPPSTKVPKQVVEYLDE